VPVAGVLILIVMALALIMVLWIAYRIGKGMARDKDAMQIGPYNAWSPPPSPPFPKPDEPERSG
jgi:hypothetical protein